MVFEEIINQYKSEIDRLALQLPEENEDYYYLSLFVDENQKFTTSVSTHWIGFTDKKPFMEIREPSLVAPNQIIKMYSLIEEPVFILNSEKDLLWFCWVLGGNSIIKTSIAKEYLGHLFIPTATVNSLGNGFVDLNSIPKEKLNRAPSPKLRMKILTRDKRRCKICGASPANNEHVELHLHHIIPFANGGLTDENNLITLCHTCHKGLIPHLDYSLFDNINVELYSSSTRRRQFKERLAMNIIALDKFRSKIN